MNLSPEEARAALNDLGAYRLLRHFEGDWKRAQAYTQNTRGTPLFKGKRAWIAAKVRAQKRIAQVEKMVDVETKMDEAAKRGLN